MRLWFELWQVLLHYLLTLAWDMICSKYSGKQQCSYRTLLVDFANTVTQYCLFFYFKKMVNYEQWAGTGFTEQALQRFNFIEIILWHGCSPINLMPIFRTIFPKKTSGGLLLGFSGAIWLLSNYEQTFNFQWPNFFLPSQVMLDVTTNCLLSLLR